MKPTELLKFLLTFNSVEIDGFRKNKCTVGFRLQRFVMLLIPRQNMEQCSPVEMRKSLELVGVFRKTGIRFVPMPVFDDEDHAKEVDKM